MLYEQRQRAAFVGVGHSRVMRHDDVPLGVLAAEACHAAVKDAGLDMADIDGITCIPDQPFASDSPFYDGAGFVSANLMIRTLGIQARWAENVNGLVIRSVVEAINAVEAGLCNYALVFRALHNPRGAYGHTNPGSVSGVAQFEAPYGAYYPAYFAQMWNRYRHKYGSGTREQMSTLVVQSRANGLISETSYWRQHRPEVLTVDEYLAARVVSAPISVYDCDMPIQGCGAFVLTTAERGIDLPNPPGYVHGVAEAAVGPARGLQPVTLEREMECGALVAKELWRQVAGGPSAIDVANLYDGFSIIPLIWLEALGFCDAGEAFDFIQGGRIGLAGDLPLNTSGGNLGSGRMHGVPHIMESILQVTGRAGERQVKGVDMALAAVGPIFESAALILSPHPR